MSVFFSVYLDICRPFEFFKIFMLNVEVEEKVKKYAYLTVVRTSFLFLLCLEMEK